MRIGNLDDLDKTENSENLIQLMQTAGRENLSKAEKWKNWWHYYKWYVVCGIILLGITLSLIRSVLGIGERTPDLQIAYVGKAELPQEAASALENAFASIAEDYNDDGKVIVQLNQYIDGNPNPDAEMLYYEYASEVSLIGDISSCESYFFLLDDPARFQKQYQILALPDGSCPGEEDHSAEGKFLAWTDCKALAEMELGTYSAMISGQTVSGDVQELLSGLFLGRRCFYNDNTTENAAQCAVLWDTVITTD